jgi:predicted transcriptional regulator
MNTTTEIRNDVFLEILPGLRVQQLMVLGLLRDFGPCTTRQLAERSKVSIFTVRPRVCELVDLELAVLDGKEGREGVYRAVSREQISQRLSTEAGQRNDPVQEELL